jgi:hypothetical protein
MATQNLKLEKTQVHEAPQYGAGSDQGIHKTLQQEVVPDVNLDECHNFHHQIHELFPSEYLEEVQEKSG